MEDVAIRIKELIQSKGMSNSELADAIDLPRPILSHILSGRNKPSLLVIQKIISGYPDVNPNWLLLGSGDMLLNSDNRESIQTTLSSDRPEKNVDLFSSDLPEPEKEATITKTEIVNTSLTQSSSPPPSTNRNLIQIVHYYSDGTFKVFDPQ
jgi:transcriptional regulator with XRE-family HTH domain